MKITKEEVKPSCSKLEHFSIGDVCEIEGVAYIVIRQDRYITKLLKVTDDGFKEQVISSFNTSHMVARAYPIEFKYGVIHETH